MVKKLGRGLDSLIRKTEPTPPQPVEPEAAIDYEIRHIDPTTIAVNRDQPRARFSEDGIQELARSIANEGILQPLVVRTREDGSHELVAGERRLRASLSLKLDTVPVVVRDLPTESLLELALVENIQREDLNPIELARAYKALREKNGWTQAELADQLGKKRPTVANVLRYLELPVSVQDALAAGEISSGHAKALLGVTDLEQQQVLFTRTIEEGLSVRDLEQLVRGEELVEEHDLPDEKPPTAPGRSGVAAPRDVSSEPKPAHLVDQENILSAALGTKVEIRESAGAGKILVEFYSGDDFERIKQQILAGRDRSTQ